MLDSNPRTKLISLRLSEGEYEALKTRYRAFGARNISDLARLALERLMTISPGAQKDVAAKVAELGDRVRALESHIPAPFDARVEARADARIEAGVEAEVVAKTVLAKNGNAD